MDDELEHPSVEDMDLGKIMTALADPHRRAVVTELLADPADTERTCASFNLPVSKSTLTHHFRVLRESGLVLARDCGNQRPVVLRRADLEHRFPGLLDLLAHESVTRGAR